jgi:hypothetical protein
MTDNESGWRQGTALVGRFLDSKSGALAVSLLFTLGMIYHYVVPLNAFLLPGWWGNDNYQMVWNLWFANESITHGHNPYVTNMIYYPIGANLSHHTLAPGFFPITFLVKLVMRGDLMYPIYAYKIIIFVSFALILYFSYLLLRELSLSRWVSATGAVAYAFSDFYTLHAQHINHLAGFFFPLTALFMVRFYKRPASANALMVAVTAAGSIYFTEFALYIYLSAGLFVLLMILFGTQRQQLREKLRTAGGKRLLTAVAVFLLILAPFAVNLLGDHVVRPSYGESSAFSANLAGFFIPTPAMTPLYGRIFTELNSKITAGVGGYEVFLGFPLMLFAVLGFVKASNRLIRFSAVPALVFLVLSLGPTLKIFGWDSGFPLPYSLLMRVPPFDLGRTPVRFFVVGLFFLVIVSAAGMAQLERLATRRWGPRWRVAILALMFFWVTAEAYSPFASQPPFVPPAGLEKIVEGPVLNLPPYPYDGYAALLQTFHHQPIGTGYLARTTTTRMKQFRQLRQAWDRGGQVFCDRVKEMGFRNIVITPSDVVWHKELGSVAPPGLSKCSINVVDLRAGEIERPDNFPPYIAGTRIDLRSPDTEKYLWYGWSGLEPEYRWTDRGRAAIVFALNQVKPAVLRMQMGAFLVPGKLDQQIVNIALNGHPITTVTVKQVESKEYSIVLPAELLQEHNVVSLELPNAESPASFSLSDDERLLGISVTWVEIDFLNEPPK